LKNGLILPITQFRGETRYVLADLELYFLIKVIQEIRELDSDVNYIKERYKPPADEEIEKRKVSFADEVSFKKYLNMKELGRYAFKIHTKKERGPKGLTRLEKEVETHLKKIEINKVAIINNIKKTHDKPLKKYAFLSDVIGASCPSLFQ
jgi:hypothetical protein